MAKRFTDTEKWRRPWFRKLAPAYKLLWTFVVDNCDHAGIWYVDIEAAAYHIGAEVTESEALKLFAGHVQVISDGTRWFVPDFVEFQYGAILNPSNKAHASVLSILSKHGIEPSGTEKQAPSEPLASPLQGDKDKDMDKEKDKEKVTTEKDARTRDRISYPSSPEDALPMFQLEGAGIEEATDWFLVRSRDDWKRPTQSGHMVVIINWSQDARLWARERKNRKEQPNAREQRNRSSRPGGGERTQHTDGSADDYAQRLATAFGPGNVVGTAPRGHENRAIDRTARGTSGEHAEPTPRRELPVRSGDGAVGAGVVRELGVAIQTEPDAREIGPVAQSGTTGGHARPPTDTQTG